ncbi:glycerate kinase [Paenibacillus antri]|uniref:Glycerate kinase n=1 Tax=Paenibacillus antri TaxID=2582848 RepID=A0A5R9G3I8_9BACL|nr:glycerate kinase [Paenibacillus antri]TLS48690.1 glycerate kinase [Paenibacillus antri]
MNIVIAPDSFKGCLSSEAAADAIERGIRRVLPEARIAKVPIADGGEGTLDSLLASAGGRRVPVRARGPLGDEVEAEFGVLSGSGAAVIEMAKASGLGLVEDADRRNPLLATTYGTGQLLRAALDEGCRDFILAVGGSATNDGGAGMLQALGLRLLDADGAPVEPGGGALARIAAIDDAAWDPRIAESRFVLASDVSNPLLGPSGASHVFGPQKGATPEDVEELERNMASWADVVERVTGVRLHDLPGAGAAGGLGGAFLAFFPAELRRGIDVVLEVSPFRDALRDADLVITGEGRIDSQTASGKTPMGVAQEARKAGVPTIAIAGSVGPGIEALYPHGIEAVFSLANGPMSLSEAMDRAEPLLAHAAEQVVRALRVGASGRRDA